MFINCWSLSKVVLPETGSNALLSLTSMFQSAYNIRDIQNTSVLGSVTGSANVAFGSFLVNNGGNYLTGSLSFGAGIGQIAVNGTNSTQMLGVSGIRLTNTGSLFGGGSPQVNVSYTQLNTGSLQTLFNDIAATPASGSVRTINITGALGTTGSTTNSMTFTSGSNIVNTTSGNVILPGFELTTASTGTPPMNWMNVTFDIANDLVIPSSGSGGNNIPNGKVIYFTVLNNGSLSIYKPYYVINSNATNFQLSLTSGGSAIDITGASGGTNTLGWTANVVSYSGFSMVMDSVARVSTSVSATVSPLQRINILARGWTVTG
jgi:hypothetical protein